MIPLTRGLLRVCVVSRFSCVQLFAMLLTIAPQHPLSTVVSRQEYLVALPFLHGIFPIQGSNPQLPWLLRCKQILYC